MLAYLFWHRPEETASRQSYEQAQLAFHRSLAHNRPAGLLGSVCARVDELPWLGGRAGYEDWYLLEDWTAVGVLRAAVLAPGHVSLHDRAARHLGAGTAAIYRLCEGSAQTIDASVATWVSPGRREGDPAPGELLADGLKDGSLWRRELVLGPAGEFCVLCDSPPAGLSAQRLGADWRLVSLRRDVLWRSV